MQARGGDKKNSSLSKKERRKKGGRKETNKLDTLYAVQILGVSNIQWELSELSMFLVKVNLDDDPKIEDLCKLEKQSNVMTKKYQQCWCS